MFMCSRTKLIYQLLMKYKQETQTMWGQKYENLTRTEIWFTFMYLNTRLAYNCTIIIKAGIVCKRSFVMFENARSGYQQYTLLIHMFNSTVKNIFYTRNLTLWYLYVCMYIYIHIYI